jgi:two-component system response regulator TctD
VQALNVLSYQAYALLILDLGLPRLDGMAVLKQLRAGGNRTPVLVLTARSAIDDRVTALDYGADDYLVKPVDLRELSARCRALMRRSGGEVSSITHYGNLSFDRAASVVCVDGQALDLRRRELCLLDLLLRHQGRTLSKGQIADQLTSFDDQEEVSDNAIELHIARLRKKLAQSSVSIRTLRGIGYLADVDA